MYGGYDGYRYNCIDGGISLREYIQALGAAAILAALIDMLVPEGSFKKYCRLVCGFMVAAVMLSPLTGSRPGFSITDSGLDAEAAEAEARARVLMEHKNNIEKIIEEKFPGCDAHVEVNDDGSVSSAALNGSVDEAAAREYLRSEIGVEGSEVKINENKAASEG